jgi:hypothetical protein
LGLVVGYPKIVIRPYQFKIISARSIAKNITKKLNAKDRYMTNVNLL